jgi:hypothetical protein
VAFEAGKTPADVFHRLVEIFGTLHVIARNSGESTLHLKVRALTPSAITPSDAYDVASMVFSEIAYLYSLVKEPQPVEEPSFPEHRILPSHVYQLAGTLKTQLVQLKQLSATHPNWLRDR